MAVMRAPGGIQRGIFTKLATKSSAMRSPSKNADYPLDRAWSATTEGATGSLVARERRQ